MLLQERRDSDYTHAAANICLKNILIATDFSIWSEHPLRNAATLAHRHNATRTSCT
jgi:hypothetical protein